MTTRLFRLLLIQFFGMAVGAWVVNAVALSGTATGSGVLRTVLGAAAGFAISSWLWVALDVWLGSKLLQWLRGDAVHAREAPSLPWTWGELADRIRRHLRASERQAEIHRDRLQDMLSALQVSPNGVMLLDGQMRIEWCNQPSAAHFGIDLQRDALQMLGNLVREPALTAYVARQDFSREVLIEGRSSTATRPIRLSVQLHPYGEGRVLLLSRDVTALEQAEAMRRDFVANVSHEIRTPLTVLAGFVETLKNLPLSPEERAHYLDVMSQQATRMQALVEDLLTLSRLEGRTAPGLEDKVLLGELLRQCEAEARTLSDLLGRGHSLNFPPHDSAVSGVALCGTESELHSALSNLLGNAIRYTPTGGTITVKWSAPLDRQEGASWILSIHDTGPGIEPEHLPRLTERFYRMDSSRSRGTGGTGLGLAIVKHVMQRHGGELRIETELGQGSTFSLLLPAQRVHSSQ
jgi:two-component system phosphate regulon sensor histidine kinase PhoR